MAKKRRADPYKNPQPTLEGYDIWVLRKLSRALGKKPGPAAAWIINRWITDNPELLEGRWGIRNKDYRDDGNVIDLPSAKGNR